MTSHRLSTSVLCFIVCDTGPAIHFAAFANHLLRENNNPQIHIYASGPALTKLNDLQLADEIQLHPFSINDTDQQDKLARELIDDCLKHNAQTIITDIGNQFDAKLQTVSTQTIRIWCYYDNPEPYVPGGYSIKTAETIKVANRILFANLNLAKENTNIFSSPDEKIDLSNKTIQGIGYYPVTDIEKLKQQRLNERDTLRAEHGWLNIKYLFVYFGGNNDAYFDQAFPTFLSSLSQIDPQTFVDTLFLLHQHPAAKKENRDGLLLQDCLSKHSHLPIQLSTFKTSDQAQIIADAALYYQTSMAPQFALLGLPTLQIAHDIYSDVLVKYNLCYTATNAFELEISLKAIKQQTQSEVNTQLIYDAIGYNPDWPMNVRDVIFSFLFS